MTAAEILKQLENDERFNYESNKNDEQLNPKVIQKFEAMSIDDQLKLKGKERIDLKKYYAYKEELRKKKIQNNELELQGFYKEIKATGLDTDYYKGIEEHQLNKKIIQIILKHLGMEYSQDVLKILVDKLQSRKARGMAGEKLVNLYRISDNGFSFQIAQVLETVATENELEEILSIFNNPELEDEGKDYLPLVLAKLMGKQAIPILTKIVNEKKSKEETQAKKALRKINSNKQIVPKLPKGIKHIKDNKFAYKYEASTEYDMEDVPDFLNLVCEKIGADPKALESLILDTEVEQTKTYELQVNQLLRTSKLYFQIFMDDIDTPGLYFFSESRSLIKSITKIIDKYIVD